MQTSSCNPITFCKPPKKKKHFATKNPAFTMSVTAWSYGIQLASIDFENHGIGLISTSVLHKFQAVLVHHGCKPICNEHEQYILFNVGNGDEFVDISSPHLLRSGITPHIYYLNAADWQSTTRAKQNCRWCLSSSCPSSVMHQVEYHCSTDPSVYNVIVYTTDIIRPKEELLVDYYKPR